jgi:lantibiotic biosynthesis protein
MTVRADVDDRIAAVALEAAEGLAGAAIIDRNTVRWESQIVADVRDGAAVLGHGDVGVVLYDGSAGIALTLAAAAVAAERTGLATAARAAGQRWRAVAAGAARTAVEKIELRAGSRGLFDGGTGIALAALRTGLLLGDDVLTGQALAAAHRADKALAEAVGAGAVAEPDLISGMAGDILGLLEIDQLAGEDAHRGVAQAAAHLLADRALLQTWGSAWPTGASGPAGPPLLGLGHGAAGIALALAEVAVLTDDDALRRAAREGLEYERGWYDPEAMNWPDLREADSGADPDRAPAASLRGWCHGAFGIGLSRLRIAALTGEPLARAEAAAALQVARDQVVASGAALQHGGAVDVTPCHGLAGAVELFLVAADALGLPAHRRAARRAAALVVSVRDAAGRWPCGLPGAGEVPGLMTGIAGAVLTLLRASGAIQTATPLLPGPSGW